MNKINEVLELAKYKIHFFQKNIQSQEFLLPNYYKMINTFILNKYILYYIKKKERKIIKIDNLFIYYYFNVKKFKYTILK